MPYSIILYFRSPSFHVSNCALFQHSTSVLSFYIDVVLTLSSHSFNHVITVTDGYMASQRTRSFATILFICLSENIYVSEENKVISDINGFDWNHQYILIQYVIPERDSHACNISLRLGSTYSTYFFQAYLIDRPWRADNPTTKWRMEIPNLFPYQGLQLWSYFMW